MKKYRKLLELLLSISILYLIVSFIKWDIIWIRLLPLYSVTTRSAIIIFGTLLVLMIHLVITFIKDIQENNED